MDPEPTVPGSELCPDRTSKEISMRRIAVLAALVVGLSVALPAWAVIYMGNPNNSTHCSFVDKTDPGTYTDDELDYIAGTGSQPFSNVTTECDKNWVTIQFGGDVQPGPNWKRRVLIVTNGNLTGSTDQAYCTGSYDGVEHFEIDVFAEL